MSKLPTKILKGLTARQAAGLTLVAGLCLGVSISAFMDQLQLSVVGLALLTALAFLSTLQLRRRLAHERRRSAQQIRSSREQLSGEIQQMRQQLGDVEELVTTSQRRILAVVETERFDAAQRHHEVLANARSNRNRLVRLLT